MKVWIWVSFFFFYGNVFQVEMCSKSLKVCVFELRGVRESWWDWMAEIGRKASPFCFVSSCTTAVPGPPQGSQAWLTLLSHKGFSLSPLLSLLELKCM